MPANKVVVITGGAGLLGREFADAVAAKGGWPVIADIDLPVAQALAKDIATRHPQIEAHAVRLDITSRESLQAAISHIHTTCGKIDALVNNAYPRNKNYGRPLFEVEYGDFCENMSMHLGGYFLASQQFSKYFLTQGFGNIVNISSIYGVIAPRFEIYDNTPMTMPVEYAVIKSGLLHLTKYFAKSFKGKKIRVNAISPGGIFNHQPEKFLEAYKKLALNKGMLDPKDLTGSLIYLLSDQSEFVNGQNIVVDDGFTL